MESSVIKACYYTVMGWLSSMVFYFTPIHGLIAGLTIAFFLSFGFGILSGILKQNEQLDLKKAFRAFGELATYLVIIASLFVIGEKMKDGGLVFEVLSAITWGMIYFYVANWTKNLKRLFPSSRGISFIHYILGLEILKNLPLLKNFVEKNPENEQQSPSDN